VLSGLEGLLDIVGLEVMAKSVSAGTHSESWRERIPDCMSCDTETAGDTQSAKNGTESRLVFDNVKRTTGMMNMHKLHMTVRKNKKETTKSRRTESLFPSLYDCG